jgi:predicted transcriptional regulator with HTH domain
MNTNVTYGIINGYNIKDKCLFKLNSAFIEQKILVNIRDIFPKMNYHSLVSKLLKFLPSNKTTMVFRDKNS